MMPQITKCREHFLDARNICDTVGISVEIQRGGIVPVLDLKELTD